MARVKVPIAVIDAAGNAVAGAAVHVKHRGTGTTALTYLNETGPTTVANPLTTDSFGRLSSWVEAGKYVADITGTGITAYSEPFEAAPAVGQYLEESVWTATNVDSRIDVLEAVKPTVVTSLPGSPVAGQEVYYRFTQSVTPSSPEVRLWHLRYDGTISRWLPVGAQEPVTAFDAVARSQAFGVGWSQYTQVMNASLPLPGIYRLLWGAGQWYSNIAANWYTGIFINGTWPSSGTTQPSAGAYAASGGAPANYESIHGNFRAVSAAGVITWGAFVSVAGTVLAQNRYLEAYPIQLD